MDRRKNKMENIENFDDGITQVAKKEFNLSDCGILHLDNECWIKVRDFKEFIRRLKELINEGIQLGNWGDIEVKIDKLAGDKLI